MATILVLAGLTLLASFLCSLFEAVLYSITPSQLELLKRHGQPGAARLARLRADVEAPIAAILTVNTVAHTVGAAWCGALVGEHFGSAAIGAFAAVFTFLVLVLTEIVPKSIGVRHARRLGPLVAWPIQWMVWLAWPIAHPAQAAMRRLSGRGRPAGPTEEEVLLFSDLAARSGEVRADEHGWMRNALRLDRVTVAELRTPRPVVESLPAETTVAEATRDPGRWNHSRLPLFEGGDRDRIVGQVLRREAFEAALSGRGDEPLSALMRPIRFVPEAMRAPELLELFLVERRHLCAVADEYGAFDGVVTLEDVLEQLVGREIVDEHDQADDMQELARRESPFGGGSDPAPGGKASGDRARGRPAEPDGRRGPT